MNERVAIAALLTTFGVLLGFDVGLAQASGSTATSTGPLPPHQDLATWAEEGAEGLERARSAIMGAVPSMTSSEATTWVQLLSVIERVDPSSAPVAIRAVGTGIESSGSSGAEILMGSLDEAASADRAALLALAAQLASAESAERAAQIRARLLDQYPDAAEAVEMRLLQASWLLAGGDRPEEGMRLLEELIVGAPQHPLAPEARRLYEAHGGRGGSASPGGVE